MTTAERQGVKRPGGVRTGAAKGTGTRASKGVSEGMPKGGQDPKGGLTAKGRKFYEETEGLHLRPGVKGKADTPEKIVRKGSFLRRHFAHPQGPVKDKDGQPTRQALEAAAWGEPVPQSTADERKLANTGKKLLEQYHALRDKEQAEGKKAAKKPAPKKTPGKRAVANKPAGKKAAAKKR